VAIQLPIPAALNDPTVWVSTMVAAVPSFTADAWKVLDWGLLLSRTDAALPGNGILDQWSVLDPLLALTRTNAALAVL
jgi:hypothetical protein